MSSVSILIVEDEVIIANSIKKTLEQMGYNVSAIVVSGEEAVKKTRDLLPDLVLMDIKLKGKMDGITAAEMIKSECYIPVVYLTAYGDEATMRRARVTEPYGFILKPVEDRELRCNIEIALYKHSIEKLLREKHRHLSSVIDGVDDVVFSVDSNNHITTWNKSIQILSEYSSSEILHRSVVDLDVFENIDEVINAIELIQKGKDAELKKIILKTKKKDTRVIHVSKPTLIFEDGKKQGSVVFIGQDITSRYDNLSKLQDGSSYLIVNDEEDTLTFLKSVAEMNYRCLVITRNKPDYIKKIFKPKKIQIAVLKGENDGSRFVVSNLDELDSMIKQFCSKYDNTAILITGMDYLLNSYSFDEILKTIYRLNDVIHESTTLFFMRISDQTIFTEKQMKSLQSELKVLPLPSISDFIVDIQLMDILRYIQKEGKPCFKELETNSLTINPHEIAVSKSKKTSTAETDKEILLPET